MKISTITGFIAGFIIFTVAVRRCSCRTILLDRNPNRQYTIDDLLTADQEM